MSGKADKTNIPSLAGMRDKFEEDINFNLFNLRVNDVPKEVAEEDTQTILKLKAIKSMVDSAKATKLEFNDDNLGLKVNQIIVKLSLEDLSKPLCDWDVLE